MLTTWDQRARREGIKIVQINFPVPTTQDDLYPALREGDHAAHQGAALLPHHQSHRPDVPGEAAVAAGASARHPDHRRRRARVRALPVQAVGSRMRLLRYEPAQVAARAAQHRLSLRPPRTHRADVAADRGAGTAQQRHPQVRRGRHDRGGAVCGDQRSDRLPPGDRRRAEGGTHALSDDALGQPVEVEPAHADAHRSEQAYGLANVGIEGIKAADINRSFSGTSTGSSPRPSCATIIRVSA